MILGERSKVRIRGIKGKLEERERDFWHFWRSWKRKRKPERKKERRRGEETKPKTNILWRKERRSCIPKSSYTQIISEGEVRSLTSVYNK